MTIRDELEAEAKKLRGIKAPHQQGNGHNFTKTGTTKGNRALQTRPVGVKHPRPNKIETR